jgi:(S)-citramalyl-CoA lyase
MRDGASTMKGGAGWTSLLFVPGTRPDRFAKALASGADLVCIDLEDGVAPGDKDGARAAALDALAGGDERLALRINGLDTEMGLRDLLALKEAGAAPAALLLPMVDSPALVRIAAGVLGDAAPPLVPLVESRAGLAAAADIAAAPGVAGMMFGGGDLSAELGLPLAWEPLAAARGAFLLACAGRGLSLIDVPFTALDDAAGLEAEARKARALGFTAKAAIHPAQVSAIARIFAPDAAELAEAREALAAWRAGGGGAVRHAGRLIEAPLARRYEHMLATKEDQDHA